MSACRRVARAGRGQGVDGRPPRAPHEAQRIISIYLFNYPIYGRKAESVEISRRALLKLEPTPYLCKILLNQTAVKRILGNRKAFSFTCIRVVCNSTPSTHRLCTGCINIALAILPRVQTLPAKCRYYISSRTALVIPSRKDCPTKRLCEALQSDRYGIN